MRVGNAATGLSRRRSHMDAAVGSMLGRMDSNQRMAASKAAALPTWLRPNEAPDAASCRWCHVRASSASEMHPARPSGGVIV